MKRLFLLLFVIININQMYSQICTQRYHSNFKYCKIDTVTLFDPIGFIGVSSKRKMVPDDSLTSKYIQVFNSAFMKNTKFSTKQISGPTMQTDSTQKYFVDLMYKLDRLSDAQFVNNRISDRIRALIKDKAGRYYGIVCYSGYENRYAKELLITEAIMLTATLLLSGGTFWIALVPRRPYYNVYFAIIDKEKDCVLYFNSYKVNQSPLNGTIINKSIKKLLIGIKPSN